MTCLEKHDFGQKAIYDKSYIETYTYKIYLCSVEQIPILATQTIYDHLKKKWKNRIGSKI